MIAIAGYDHLERIEVFRRTTVYRGRRIRDKALVRLRVPIQQPPDQETLAALKRAYRMGTQVSHTALVRYVGLEPFNESMALISQDFPGQPLSEVKDLSLYAFLNLAIQLADALVALQSARIIHGGIRAHNILYQPDTGRVRLGNFSQARSLPRPQEGHDCQTDDCEVAYLSPEQTGCMNREIDNRSDFYALGVTFYQLLTGLLPFRARDTRSLIKEQLNSLPVPPAEIDHEIPIVVSDIVMRLLAREADSRYQSAAGLKQDLASCMQQWESQGEISYFQVGRHDHPANFVIPSRLYGREHDLRDLHKRIEDSFNGAPPLVMISGDESVGKTTFAKEAGQLAVERGGILCYSSFSKTHPSLKSGALFVALQNYLQQLLTENSDARRQIRARLRQGLGDLALPLLTYLPALQELQGISPKPGMKTNLEMVKAALSSLLSCLPQKETPLLLILDNLQFAQAASLDLLKALTARPGHFCIIGIFNTLAPRYNSLLADLMDERVEDTRHIFLENLKQEAIASLIRDTLKCSAGRANSLAVFFEKKCHGNPLFIKTLLREMYQEDLFQLDHHVGRWIWQEEQVFNYAINGTLMTHLSQRLGQLSQLKRRLLGKAAYVGHYFQEAFLFKLLDKDPNQLREILEAFCQEGFIYPLEECSDFHETYYAFAHPTMCKAAQTLICGQKQVAIHRRIGQLLMEQDNGESATSLLQIVDHLNHVKTLEGRCDNLLAGLRDLNLEASERLKNHEAFQQAEAYLGKAFALMPDKQWTQETESAMKRASKLGLELAYIRGDFSAAKAHSEALWNHTDTSIERVAQAIAEAKLLIPMSQWKLARSRLLAGFLEAGLPLHRGHNSMKRLYHLLRLRFTDTPRAITGQAKEDAAQRLELLHLMSQTARALGERDLEMTCLYHHVRLSWSEGALPLSYYAHVRLSRLLNKLERHQLSARLKEHSMRLAEYFSQFNECCDGLLEQCHQAIADGLPAYQWEPLLKKARRASILSGNFRALRKVEVLGLLSDTSSCLSIQSQRCDSLLARYGGDNSTEPCMMLVKLRHAFLEQSQQAKMEATRLKDLRPAKGAPQLVRNYAALLHLPLTISLDNIQCRQLQAYFDEATTDTHPAAWTFETWILLAQSLIQSADHAFERRKKLSRLKALANKMHALSNAPHSPSNALYLLLKAELAAHRGHFKHTSAYYNQALQAAQASGQRSLEALINERAGYYYESAGQESQAGHFLKEAAMCYRAFGSQARAHHLERTLGRLLGEAVLQNPNGVAYNQESDLPRILELEPLCDHLLPRLAGMCAMRSVYLILERSGGPELVSEYHHNLGLMKHQSVPLSIHQSLPRATIERVMTEGISQLHLEETVANEEGISIPRKGAHCLALLHNQKIHGALYLETDQGNSELSETRASQLTALLPKASEAIAQTQAYTAILEQNHHLQNTLQSVRTKAKEWERRNEALISRQRACEMRQAQLEDQLARYEQQSGYTEITASVMHNVGNLLNSVVTSSQDIRTCVRESKVPDLLKANRLLRMNMENLEDFIANDPRGRTLLEYYLQVGDCLNTERHDIEENVARMSAKIDHLREIITTQQSLVFNRADSEEIVLPELIEETLGIFKANFERHNIQVSTTIGQTPRIKGIRTKLMHAMINIFKNSVEAMNRTNRDERYLNIQLFESRSNIELHISDTGHPSHHRELMNSNQEANDKALALQVCTATMQEIGGSFRISENEDQQGSVITLNFPLPKAVKMIAS